MISQAKLTFAAIIVATLATYPAAAGHLKDLAAGLPIRIDHLDHLVDAFTSCSPITVDNVIDAYHDYVKLYEQQASLTSSFGQSLKDNPEDLYKRFADILADELLDLTTKSLFKVIEKGDYPLNQLAKNKHLRRKIGKKIDKGTCK